MMANPSLCDRACAIPRRLAPVWAAWLALALAAGGCSASYDSERLFWKAERSGEPVFKNAAGATAEQVVGAVEAYRRVIRRAPGTAWAARAQAAIGSLHVARGHYPEAREAYALVLQNYHRHDEICLSARLAIAKTYESEQAWERAATAYEEVASNHPWTTPGLESPLYAAGLYEAHGMPEQATLAHERAVRRYLSWIPEAPSQALATHVRVQLALAYQRLGRWDEAANMLEALSQAPEGVNRPLALLSLASIYQMKTSKPEQAKAVYRTLAEEFPEHPFGKAARAELERLGAPADPLHPEPESLGERATPQLLLPAGAATTP